MRLIDADVLEKIIDMECCRIINGNLTILDIETGRYRPLLDKIPTAYDKKNVIAQLKSEIKDANADSDETYEERFFEGKSVGLGIALQIVKAGGIDG